MLYRIDLEHFLTHAIDFFTYDELMHFQYLLIGTVQNSSCMLNVAKANELFPSAETHDAYISTKNFDVMEKMYIDDLKDCDTSIYMLIVNPLLKHRDIMIVSRQSENPFIDVLSKYLKKRFHIPVMDLTQLFSTGEFDITEIDHDDVRDKAVDIRRAAAREMYKAKASTREGRLDIVSKMSTKEKLAKLKDIGVNVTKRDKDKLSELLIDTWVEDGR